MNVLAFDTCLGAVSAAVRWRGPEAVRGWRLREAYEMRAAGHAERLFPMIAEVMDGAGIGFAGLDRIAVTVGPGTFTGVRIGVAAARALALATAKPVVAATSLAVMAHRAEELLGEALGTRRLMVAVDARPGALYVQSFGAGAIEAGPAALATPQEAARSIADASALIVGPAAETVAALAREAGGDAEARFPDLQPHARSLAVLADRLAPSDAAVRPLYLRPLDVRPQEGAALARVRA
jgi:tRNA threonylcarbamoyladenosine biosynthesis protein TsaB